jgi:predicted chitinase
VRDIVEIKKNVRALAKFTLVNRGFKSEIDPTTGKTLYRDAKGKFAKSSDATFAQFKETGAVKRGNTGISRTDALSAAIAADEDPMIRLADTVESILKSLGQDNNKSIHQKLDDLIRKNNSGDDGFDIDTPDRRRNRPNPKTNKKPGKFKTNALRALRYARAAAPGATVAATAIGTVGLVVGGAAYMASGKAADEAKKPMKELERIYGLKVLYDPKGATTGYIVDGKKYGLNDLPQEYKDLIDAYGPGDKRSATARDAIARINANPEKYNALKLSVKSAAAVAAPAPKPPASPVSAANRGAMPGSSTVSTATAAARSGPVTAATGGGGTGGGSGGSRGSIDVSSTEAGITQSLAETDKSVSSDIKNMTGSPINIAMQEAGLNNKFAQIALLANIKKESNFKPISENMNYKNTALDRIRKIFGKRAARYDDAQLTQIKSSPTSMGELMYGKDTSIGQSMGNTEPGDGFKYRGRGYIQLTGKNNYRFYGKKVGEDLVKNPDLANDPTVAAKISASYVMTALKGKQDFADQKTANYAVTKAIGGNLDLTKGYGAEILAKVNAYSGESGLVASAGAPASGGGGGGGGGGSTTAAPPAAAPSMVAAAPSAAPSAAPPAAAPSMVAAAPSTAAPSMVAAAPSSSAQLTPVVSTTGNQVAQGSAQLASSQMTAQAAPPTAAPMVVNNSSGGGKQATPPPNQPMQKASTRSDENAFNRAISRDFAHPTSFTSAIIA